MDYLKAGGQLNVVQAQVKKLLNLGHKVVICGPLPSEADFDQDVDVVDVAVPSSARNIGGILTASRQLKKQASHFKPDFVISHGLRSSLIQYFSAHSAVSVIVNHGQPPHGLASTLMTAHLSRKADLAVSNFPIQGSRWLYVPFVSPLCAETKMTSAAKSTTSNRIGWFGRLSPPKRPDVWIEILASVTQEIGEDVVGVVVGDGPLMVETQNLASSKLLDVKFTGHLDPISTFQHMDISVSWSNSEGQLPLALQEAVWSGVPSVTNRLPGIEAFFGTDMPGLVDTPQEAVEEILKLQDPNYFKEVLSKQQARIIELMGRRSLNDLLINFIQTRQVDVSV